MSVNNTDSIRAFLKRFAIGMGKDPCTFFTNLIPPLPDLRVSDEGTLPRDHRFFVTRPEHHKKLTYHVKDVHGGHGQASHIPVSSDSIIINYRYLITEGPSTLLMDIMLGARNGRLDLATGVLLHWDGQLTRGTRNYLRNLDVLHVKEVVAKEAHFVLNFWMHEDKPTNTTVEGENNIRYDEFWGCKTALRKHSLEQGKSDSFVLGMPNLLVQTSEGIKRTYEHLGLSRA
jgi:hypothetical protein